MKVEDSGESLKIQQVVIDGKVVAEIAPGFGARWIGLSKKPTVDDLRGVVDALVGSRSDAPLELSGMLRLTDIELFQALSFEKIEAELEAVRQGGYCNMLDVTCLSDVLQQLGFADAFILTSQVVHRRQAAKNMFTVLLTGGQEAADKMYMSLLSKTARAAAAPSKKPMLL